MRQATRFGFRHGGSKRRDAVVAAPLVVERGRRPLAALVDQALFQHALDGAIERAGAQLQLAVCPRGDVLHDRVTMLFLAGQRHEDMKRRRRQREERVRIDTRHTTSIATLDIVSRVADNGGRG